LQVGNQLIGAIGIGGGRPGSVDVACVQAGVNMISARLK
jgi:uncharacterized protein GlcG (DUF336 family)